MKIPFLDKFQTAPSPQLEHRYLALLEPLSEAAPCGIDLEYNPDLLVIQTRATPQNAAQYGDFVAPSDSLNWREIEASLLNVLAHGKDIRALVLLLRSRIQQAGAQGAYEGLYLIAQTLERFAKHVHPQHMVDGELDLGVRANALAALVDNSAVLADLRQIVVDTSAASRLSVRDVERSMAVPRAADAPTPENLSLQLKSLKAQKNAVLLDLKNAHAQAQHIQAWVQSDLGNEAPDLSALLRLLSPFATQEAQAVPAPIAPTEMPEPQHPPEPATSVAAATPVPAPAPEPAHNAAVAHASHPHTRADALALVRTARLWFEANEPSSPVADLLRQAEKLTGKSYLEIADAIPLDLLARWRQSDAAQ